MEVKATVFPKIERSRKFLIQGWNEASTFAGTTWKRQVRFPIIPWAETLQMHHCQSRGEGALDAADLHVLPFIFLSCELHCSVIRQSLSFTGHFNLNFFCLGACLQSQVLLKLLFFRDPWQRCLEDIWYKFTSRLKSLLRPCARMQRTWS